MPRMGTEEKLKSGPTTTAVGIVIPADWDASGRPLAVALSTYKEEIFLVDASNLAGMTLGRMIHKKVKVTGWIQTQESGKMLISVEHFEVIEPPPNISPESEPVISPP